MLESRLKHHLLARLAQTRDAAKSYPRTSLATTFRCQRRSLQNSPGQVKAVSNLAFAFDIDGVLVRGPKALPRANKTLSYLQHSRIPFILLTNGGGYHEVERASKLTKELGVSLDSTTIVQSHTPFADMQDFKDKCVLVVGGEYDTCRLVAEKYGYKNVVTPSDIFIQHPEIYPFSKVFDDYHRRKSHARPLPKPIVTTDSSKSLKIDAIFVYSDPREWALDNSIIIDCLLSSQGILGTLSSKNNNPDLPNRGYQQDGQPPLYFSNPDLWFAAEFNLPRLGQGGFRAALEGVWLAVTGGHGMGVELKKTVIGKPHRETYLFAENKLQARRQVLFGSNPEVPLDNIYMVGDNPESDIRGANSYQSPSGINWQSILVRSGVYTEGDPAWKPRVIVGDVYDAVQWAVQDTERGNSVD